MLSVGNFRRGPFTSQFTPTTCVDFTFDQAAYLNNGDRSNFSLVPSSGGDAVSGTTNVQVPEGSDTEGDEIVTVVFPGDIDPANFARGFVDTGVLGSEDGNAGPDAPYAVNQSADVSPNTSTQNPDLTRVSFDGAVDQRRPDPEHQRPPALLPRDRFDRDHPVRRLGQGRGGQPVDPAGVLP